MTELEKILNRYSLSLKVEFCSIYPILCLIVGSTDLIAKTQDD